MFLTGRNYSQRVVKVLRSVFIDQRFFFLNICKALILHVKERCVLFYRKFFSRLYAVSRFLRFPTRRVYSRSVISYENQRNFRFPSISHLPPPHPSSGHNAECKSLLLYCTILGRVYVRTYVVR